ncbi:hypothetical protein B6N60_01068 [Richelia sinica FACHB-800]|uniref:Uncharacterized protein n=1 Tax=Richelia sinica FACHB-800 TaxID=1357546 RepID=A0A975T5P9_9NOST|nr:hypothetical protein B6N60_01068 [Richelia sinica FACHB-800]
MLLKLVLLIFGEQLCLNRQFTNMQSNQETGSFDLFLPEFAQKYSRYLEKF